MISDSIFNTICLQVYLFSDSLKRIIDRIHKYEMNVYFSQIKPNQVSSTYKTLNPLGYLIVLYVTDIYHLYTCLT